MDSPPTDPAVLRTVLLWAARKLAAPACPAAHRAPVKVRITTADGSCSIDVIPVGTEGTEKPNPSDFVPTAAYHVVMLDSFFSQDEKRIVREVAAGATPLKALVGRLKIERSRCATLAGNLRDRGILRTTDRGYELTPGPWAEIAGVAPDAAA